MRFKRGTRMNPLCRCTMSKGGEALSRARATVSSMWITGDSMSRSVVSRRRAYGQIGCRRAGVRESAVAKSVTECPWETREEAR